MDEGIDGSTVGTPTQGSLRRPAISSINHHTSQHPVVDVGFDEDEYIVDPRAHFNRLKDLEQETVEGSLFHQCKGRYCISETQQFMGGESKDIRNIPDHLPVCLEDLSCTPASPALRTAVDRHERKSEKR